MSVLRILFLTLALGASSAAAEDFRELAPGVGAVQVQEGHAILLSADGHPELLQVKLPAGVFYTAPGHAALTRAFLQVQTDKMAAHARADALQQALTLRSTPPASEAGTGWLLGGAAALFLTGCVVGFAVSR